MKQFLSKEDLYKLPLKRLTEELLYRDYEIYLNGELLCESTCVDIDKEHEVIYFYRIAFDFFVDFEAVLRIENNKIYVSAIFY